MAGRGPGKRLAALAAGALVAAAAGLWFMSDRPGETSMVAASATGSPDRVASGAPFRASGANATGGASSTMVDPGPGTSGVKDGPPGDGGPSPGPQPDTPLSDAERAESERISFEMSKFVRDLEYTPGLRQPPVSVVRPYEEPWRRDPSREGPSPAIEAVEPRRGRIEGGDRVLIRGRNLRVVEVMFGAAPGRILGATGTLVTVAAPPSAAGPVKIAVTNDDGTWAIAPEPFVYGE